MIAAAQISRTGSTRHSNGPTRVRSHAFDALQVPVRHGPVTIVNRRFVNYAHDQGLLVHVWTINEREEMQRLLDLGVDGLITDRPGILRELLIERGQR